MKLNKANVTKDIDGMIEGRIKDCQKDAIDYMFFPTWKALGLFGEIFPLPEWFRMLDEEEFRFALRIRDGRIMKDGKPDLRAIRVTELKKYTPGEILVVGMNFRDEGLRRTGKFLDTIKDEKEWGLMMDFFSILHLDFLVYTSAAEDRHYVEVTQDLYDAGLTHCVNEQEKADENGFAEATELAVGDYLIVNPETGSVYRVGREEFLDTHSIL